MMKEGNHENEKREIHRGEETDIQEREASFSALKIVLYTVLTIFVLFGTTTALGGYYIYSNLQPVDPESEEMIQVEIPMGSSAIRIASILKENGIIKHERLFYYYVRFKNHDGFQAGEYYLSPSMELEEIIEQLKEGRIYQQVERFTIPEGFTVEQTAERLAEQGLVDKDRFIELVDNGQFDQFSFLNEIPENENRRHRLEGLLFPETYEIYKGASEEEIIQVMLQQFEKEWNAIIEEMDAEHEGWREELAERGLTLYDLVTLASIIEREAVLDEERAIISGVFHNRLRDGWLLESCATVQFVLGKQRDRILFEDLKVEDPYNTYLNAGLPPGPIANPGRAALRAAVLPEVHDYFFFVTKKDGTGAHYFSRTYEEHLSHDAQSRGNF